MFKNFSFAGKITGWFFILSLLLIAIHLFLQYLNLEIFYEKNGVIFELSNRFDLDDEVSVPTWFSQFVLLVFGLSAFVAAFFQTHKPNKILWTTLGFIGVAFSVDESASLHEFLLQTIHVLFYQDSKSTITVNAWLLVLPLITIMALILLTLIVKYLPKRTALLMLAGGSLFLVGAVGVDLLNVAIDESSFSNQGVAVAGEELLEMSGSIISVFAVLDYLENNYPTKVRQLKKLLAHK